MRSPTPRLVAGLGFTLAVIGAFAAYTLYSVGRMRQVQTDVVERNRRAALQLIRIQSDLNSLALALRDVAENNEDYPVTAWRAPLTRIRANLQDAIEKEQSLTQDRTPEQSAFLKNSFADFWQATEKLYTSSAPNTYVRQSLQPRQEALAAMTARLLVERNDQESRAATEVARIFDEIERNGYIFLAVSALLVALMSWNIIRANRQLFEQMAELARQLITTQETTFRSISRDLHDEFGQILTALGAILSRAAKKDEDVKEAAAIVQCTLERIRHLSQSLQPVILEEQGLQSAIEWHIIAFEKQTGIEVCYQPPPRPLQVTGHSAIHVYRILQESLNNVARHANVNEVQVAIELEESNFTLRIEDAGPGFTKPSRAGIGLAAMRERAALIGATLDIGPGPASKGTRVKLRAPLQAVEENTLAR
jgi:signal transduction histidine kinase